jgi:D-alanyl-D-alanine carboxypeptidase/D-alanyl-D-alanine-endopeptidase (penicillin-binding protein 4)
MKLYTTAAGLDQLGPDFTWTTEIFADGDVTDGVLNGNIVVRGSGDPSIGGTVMDGDPLATFRAWADSLKAAGIHTISGDIIGDDDIFDDLPLGPGWMWDDESTWFSAELGALTFYDNCIELTAQGGVVGDTADVYWEPLQTSYVTVLNQSLTVHPDSTSEAFYNRRRASNVIEIGTHVRPGETTTRLITVTNATLYFVHVLGEVFESEGILVYGAARDIDELFQKPDYSDPGMKRIATRVSPPLSEITAAINKPSHNLYAEQLLKSLSLQNDTVGTTKGGTEFVVETLIRAGVDTSLVVVADGSGLSRYNLITPESTVDLLSYMWTHADTAVTGAFVRSLPIGGIDGSIKSLIKDGPAVGNLKAKTGTMTGVRSLSGYITTSTGRPIVFSLMSNHHTVPTSDVNEVQRKLADLLARL